MDLGDLYDGLRDNGLRELDRRSGQSLPSNVKDEPFDVDSRLGARNRAPRSGKLLARGADRHPLASQRALLSANAPSSPEQFRRAAAKFASRREKISSMRPDRATPSHDANMTPSNHLPMLVQRPPFRREGGRCRSNRCPAVSMARRGGPEKTAASKMHTAVSQTRTTCHNFGLTRRPLRISNREVAMRPCTSES